VPRGLIWGSMPYRVRLSSGAQLLTTTEAETPSAIGERIAECVSEGHESVHYEVTHREPDGEERKLTDAEERELTAAWGAHTSAIAETGSAPCQRCGKGIAGHEEPYPVHFSPAGPTYFGCWTAEEREQFELGLRPE
jgi:hypothetical protein